MNQLPNDPTSVNELHRYSDRDQGPEAHHHSLGGEPNQAASGSHNHDGQNSPRLASNAIPKSGKYYNVPSAEIPIKNGWLTPKPLGFVKRMGIVYVQGSISSAVGQGVFDLPVDFRPTQETVFTLATATTTNVRCVVYPAGQVTIESTITGAHPEIHMYFSFVAEL